MKRFIPLLLLLLACLLPQRAVAQECFDILNWLDVHPAVAAHLNWQADESTLLNYRDWSPAMKADLAAMAERVRQKADCGIADPPPLFYAPEPEKVTTTTLYPADAWAIYRAHVAQSIIADAFGYVGWRLDDAGSGKLRFLFDSRSFFAFAGDHFVVNYEHGGVTLGDPLFVFNFLKRHNLIGADQRETIERVLDWGRDSLFHYGRISTDTSAFQTWMRCFQYPAYPPVRVVLTGVYDPRVNGMRHWSAGCHGTGGLLMAVLRVVNIHAGQEAGARTGGHNLATFPEINAFLSHSDEVYSTINKTWPRLPIGKILLDYDRFDELFAPELNGANVSFPDLELIRRYTPYQFFQFPCRNGYSDAYTLEYFGLEKFYSTAYLLDTFRIFARRDTVLDSLGGCAGVAFNEVYPQLANPPWHPLGTEADILSAAINLPVLGQTINAEQRIITLELPDCRLPDSLIVALRLSRGARATLNGGVFYPDRPNLYTVRSEDGLVSRQWTVQLTGLNAANPLWPADPIDLYPNPAPAGGDLVLYTGYERGAITGVDLFTMEGRQLSRLPGSAATETLVIKAPLKPGTYVLRVQFASGKRAVARVQIK